MSLPRKDIKFWLDAEYHAALREICDMRGMTLGEFVERLAVAEIDRVLHEASELHARTARLGIVGNRQEKSGTARKCQERAWTDESAAGAGSAKGGRR